MQSNSKLETNAVQELDEQQLESVQGGVFDIPSDDQWRAKEPYYSPLHRPKPDPAPDWRLRIGLWLLPKVPLRVTT